MCAVHHANVISTSFTPTLMSHQLLEMDHKVNANESLGRIQNKGWDTYFIAQKKEIV